MPKYYLSPFDETVVALDDAHADAILKQRNEPQGKASRVDDGAKVGVVTRWRELHELVQECRRRRQTTGLVPTMGALHEGHLSLVAASRQHCDVHIATIFVNPTQFGPNEDFDKYPRTLERDLELLAEAGADFCFVPDVEEVYPTGCTTAVQPPEVSRRWEGECRPGHFEGVATIVLKLFHMAPVDHAFFGSKDYQQALVVQHMARDLQVNMEIHTCPIVREPDGLARSSRNRYLSAGDREVAKAVPRCLEAASASFAEGVSPSQVEQKMQQVLAAGGIHRIDYATVVDAATMAPLVQWPNQSVAIVAAFVGDTRLIDNRVLAR